MFHAGIGSSSVFLASSGPYIFSNGYRVRSMEKTAESYVVRLSVGEKMSDAEETCECYMWRQTFPVKPENRVQFKDGGGEIDSAACFSSWEEIDKRLDLFDRFILDSFLEHEECRSVLEFLGIQSACGSYDCYAICIKEWNLASLAFEDVYIDLLCFIAEGREDAFRYPSPEIRIVDGSGHLRTKRVATLVSASSRSKLMKLLGPNNPFVDHFYVDLGGIYAESSQFSGQHIPEKQLPNFISKHSEASDLDGLPPPDAPLQVASSKLTCDQAFLLLDWIRKARARDPCLPEKFVTSVRCGKWLNC
ncbi:hypothetical protein Tsubulata_033291 [Turnera subulata]|uniref:Uncharacterized protein n=1 Tax=Turnera subulata TaxID=218843 RepID=A0A9Q0FY20_9ROSI|nr:hypothetical protein Tsubulata_033291 [Turnera subulata]